MITKEAEKISIARNWIKYLAISEYKKIFDTLHAVEKDIHSKLSAKDPDIKELVHKSRMGLKDREYPKVIFYSWQMINYFNDIFTDDLKIVYELEREMIKKYYEEHGGLHQYQIQQMQEDVNRMKNLSKSSFSLPKSLLKVGTIPDFEFVSEAGIGNWVQEKLPSFKGMRGSLFEKLLKNKISKLRIGAEQALSIAEGTYRSVKEMVREMKQNNDDLVEFVKICKKYENMFTVNKEKLAGIYKANFSEFLAATQPTEEELKVENIGQPKPVEKEAPPQKPLATPPVSPQPQAENTTTPPPAEKSSTVTFPPNEEDEKKAKASKINLLVKRAKEYFDDGDKILSTALLITAADLCDDDTQRDKLYIAAKKVSGV